MTESLIMTALPCLFLAILFGGGSIMRRRNIDSDGDAPINSSLFYTSKYAIVVVWLAAVLRTWGVNFSPIAAPAIVRTIGFVIWIIGFGILFAGRFGMGDSFRIGSPQERTGLCVGGLFCISRNPMYLGVFATLIGAVLYTLNPVILLIAIFIIVVHHKIVLAEEVFLLKSFGRNYQDYCGRVRRYI